MIINSKSKYMPIDHEYYEKIFIYLINIRIIPFIEEHIENIIKFGVFTGYYKEEEKGDETYIRPIYDLSQIDVLLIGIMINELETEETKINWNIKMNINFSYDTFFPWVNQYMSKKHILCYIYPKDRKEYYIFFAKFQLNFPRITRILGDYLI